MPRIRAAVLALIALAAAPAPAAAWGFQAHKLIMSRAIDMLPDAIRPFFEANRAFIVEHCIDPDLWRSAGFAEEPPRHFLHLDAYGARPFAALPREYPYGARAVRALDAHGQRVAPLAGRRRGGSARTGVHRRAARFASAA